MSNPSRPLPTTDSASPDESDDRGQATTEYALVMLGAGLVALALVAWATAGGGAGRIGSLFDRVLDMIIGRVV
jgi:Flp pilus assembly pilin Flp